MLKKRPVLLQCVEMLILFATLTAIDRGLMDGNAFSHLNPNPYWLPVLIMATTYGTGSGLIAGVIASAIWFNWSHPSLGGTDHIEQQLRLSIQPMLWMITALIMGEVTASRRNRIADQERQHLAMERNWKKLAEIIARLTDTNRKLQVRIATEQRTIIPAMAAGLASTHPDPEGKIDAIARMIALAARTEDFTFCDVRANRVTARFGGKAVSAPVGDLPRSRLVQAMLAAPRLMRMDHAADQPFLSGWGRLAVPISGADEELAAIILIHSAAGIRITEAYVTDMLQLADLLGNCPALLGREQASATKWLAPEGKVA